MDDERGDDSAANLHPQGRELVERFAEIIRGGPELFMELANGRKDLIAQTDQASPLLDGEKFSRDSAGRVDFVGSVVAVRGGHRNPAARSTPCAPVPSPR